METLEQAKQRLQDALIGVENTITKLQTKNLKLKAELRKNPQDKKEKTAQATVNTTATAENKAEKEELTINDLKKLVGIN